MLGGVKAKCKNCGREALVDQFKLHYQLRMMVCPDCFSGKTQKAQEQKKVEEPLKPAGWDKEDEYLEKMARLKRQQVQVNFTKIPGSEHVQCTCAHCKYVFRYDPYKKMPQACPYCNEEVPRFKSF